MLAHAVLSLGTLAVHHPLPVVPLPLPLARDPKMSPDPETEASTRGSSSRLPLTDCPSSPSFLNGALLSALLGQAVCVSLHYANASDPFLLWVYVLTACVCERDGGDLELGTRYQCPGSSSSDIITQTHTFPLLQTGSHTHTHKPHYEGGLAC